MTHFDLSTVVVVCSLISFCWLSFLFRYRVLNFLSCRSLDFPSSCL